MAASSALLSGCDWVDSTGKQSAAAPTVTNVFLDDTPVGDAISVNELVTASITTSRQSASGLAQTFSWSAAPLEQGNLAVCAQQSGFNADIAASSLLDACTLASQCQLDFVPVEVDDDANLAQFSMDVPMLKASVGLQYELSVEDSAGVVESATTYSFCLIAINEAPVAVDDTFVITEGTVLNVTPETPNLLSNDSDDTDVSNTEFAIVPEALVAPEFASFFELGNDGSFTYQSNLSNLREDRLDSFQYQLSDGVFTSSGRATIRIVASNQAPQQLSAIPALAATEDTLFSVDLSPRFADPENGELNFSLAPATPLAIGSGLALSASGVLSGTPTALDVGSYALELIVSDGGLEVSADIVLDVAAAPIVVPNSAPVFIARTVFNQTITLGEAILPVTARFRDADADVLTFTMAGSRTLPFGVALNATTGILSGTPRVIGTFSALRVMATDPSGESAVSTPFTLTVQRIR